MDSCTSSATIKPEPSGATQSPYNDGFLEAALCDSLRNVPDPVAEHSAVPRGRKNPTVTLDSIKKELTFECELCGKRFRKSANFFRHKQTHGDPFNCDMCSERFFKPWDLTKHRMEKHSSSQMPACEICSKTFIEHWRLLRHMRTHSKEKRFKCEICEKSFSESGNLAKHKKQVHSKDRPFKCDVCDKSYPQKKDLQGHMLIHTMKRFACKICNEEFALLEEKRAHVSATHPHETVERTFICTVCDASFNSKIKYTNHIVTHGERRFECRICMKKFYTNAGVRKHMRSHKVEEHSRCEICNKTFSQNCNMKRHIELMHMQGDKYSCLHCSETFMNPDELRWHRETAHQNEHPYKGAVHKLRNAKNHDFGPPPSPT